MFHVKHSAPHVLLVNPWVTDFAAYNYWIKPLRVFRIGGLLRHAGGQITLIDCLDFYDKKKIYGDGKFLKVSVQKPTPLRPIPRKYSQYGMPEDLFVSQLTSIERKPDAICVTSGMTYWYPGLFKAIQIMKRLLKGVPIFLGGIYATLCYEHAREFSGADFVLPGNTESNILCLLSNVIDLPFSSNSEPMDTGDPMLADCRPRNTMAVSESGKRSSFLPYPCFDLYSQLEYVCILTSRGCPLRCSYCASSLLNEDFARRDPQGVIDEIAYWTRGYQVRNVVFYDDMLLLDPYTHIIPILKGVKQKGVGCNFHTPNGLLVREIDHEVADFLFRSSFKTIRLGFETSDQNAQIRTGGKVTNEEFQRAVRNLKKAGFKEEDIGVYIMVGMPGQHVAEAEESIAYAREAGTRPMIVEYSPVPGTSLFNEAKKFSQFDLENEPLFHNNSTLPCQWEGFTWTDLMRLKNKIRRDV